MAATDRAVQGAVTLHSDTQTRALEAADAMAELSPRCEEEWLAAVENYRRARAALLDDETARTLDEVRAERARQDASWGEQNHESLVWAAILAEEVGEANKAMLEDLFGTGGNLREELIQVAAVAAAWLECLDRARRTP